MVCTCPNCNTQFEQKRIVKPRAKKETDPSISELIKHYYEQFVFLYTDPPTINGGAVGVMLKNQLRHYTPEKLKTYINDYLVSDDKFFKEAGYNFLLLPVFLQKQAVKTVVGKPFEKSDWRNPFV